MNIEELKANWENLHSAGLQVHGQKEIQRIINRGASLVVAKINRVLFWEMATVAFATIVSAVGVVIFYFRYDVISHLKIDPTYQALIFILGFSLFLLLFLFGFLEFKLLNKEFDSSTVKDFIEGTLNGLRRYYLLYMILVMPLLFVAYLIELKYFVDPETLGGFTVVFSMSLALIGITYLFCSYYYRRHMKGHIDDLKSYLKELKD